MSEKKFTSNVKSRKESDLDFMFRQVKEEAEIELEKYLKGKGYE